MANDLTGRVIRGYEILEQIGAGGFGAVYRAAQPVLKREVAIKVVLPEFANSPDFIRRFEIEAEVVARLEHPYIVPLFDYWREPDSAYLVLRLLRGGTLQDLLEKEEPLGADQIASILDQITSALHVSHRNNVIHRDIKPANILLDDDGNAFLTDFGIAKSTDYESMAGEEGITGSISHTPPEQIQSGEITNRTDIYAVGIILYQMLSGEHPYAKTTVSQMIFKHLTEPIPELDRDDLPYEINDIVQKATAKDPADRYGDVRELASEFRSIIAGSGASFVVPDGFFDQDVFVEAENPYKGLRAFQEADADQFFGREQLITRLLDRMAEAKAGSRFLAVIGPSGSGKSSVVKAGLLPALRRGRLDNSDKWFVVEMFPSSSPFQELESALMKVAVNPVESLIGEVENERGLSSVVNRILPDDDSELLLVIDQFEELFTQVENEDVRTRFLDNLVDSIYAPDSRLRVVVTMRADFYDKPLQYREFGELLRKRIETVLPMAPEELVETITRPAEMVDVSFQSGLVDAISQDVGEQPGMLPLLQYTMTELFDSRDSQTLTLAAYQELGGVTGSLARRSEEIYTGLFFDGQQATRQMFLRLVSLGEGTEDTRRRVRRTELSTSETIDSVIDLYGRYRLLTFDKDPASREPTVEVAHEALIRTWERLRDWINESREDLRVQRRVSSAVAEWLGANKDSSFLASGARLTQFQEWRDQTELVLNNDERTYIQTSLQAEEARKEEERRIARRVQNFQRASIVLGVMVALAIVATGIFLNRATQAQNRANEAFQTLEPAQQAVTEAIVQANDAATLVVAAETEAEVAEQAVAEAAVQVTDAQVRLSTAQVLAGNAETQAANVIALTAIAPTIQAGNDRVANLESTIVPAQETVAAAEFVIANAQSTVGVAQTSVAMAQFEVTAAQEEANLAVTSVALAQEEAGAAQTEAQSALQEADAAQTDVSEVQAQAQAAQADANAASTSVAISNLTQTPISITATAGQVVLAQQQAQLATAEVLAGNAETQAANVVALTAIAPTLAAGNERVANLESTINPAQTDVAVAQTEVAAADLTLAPLEDAVSQAQSAAATAQAQAASAQEIADSRIATAQVGVETAVAQAASIEREAASISLAVNAEQALELGNFDLALALTFSSLDLNANQARARRILNEVAFGTARMSFDNAGVAKISPDSNFLAISEGNDLIIWDVGSRTIVDRLTGHTAPILDVDFSRDMTRLVTGSQDATARIWDITGWRNGASAVETAVLEDHTGAVNVTRFGFNDSLPTVFTGSDDSRIIEWSVSNGSIVRQYTGNTWAVVELIFVGDGNNFFTTVDANGTPILLYWAVGSVNPTFSEPTILFEGYNDDATRGYIGGQNGRAIEIYNTTRRSVVRQFTQGINWGPEAATALDFSPTGGLALVALNASQGDSRLVEIDIATGATVRSYTGQAASRRVDALAYNPSGSFVLTANDNILTLWDTQTGTTLRTLAAHTDVITDIRWSDDGRFAVTRSRDDNVRLWDITGADEALRQILPIETAINRGKFPGFSARGDRVVSGVWVSLFSWDVTTGERLETVSTGDEIINMIYSPTESLAISVLSNVAILWDLDAGSNGRGRSYGDESAQFTGQAAYSPNGDYIVLDDISRILVYEIDTGNRQTINKPRFEGGSVITSIAVSSDGQYVVASLGQLFQQDAPTGDIVMWNTQSGDLLYRFPVEHNRNINWVAFSANGSQVLSASDDDTLILWNVSPDSASLIRRFAGHSGDVNIGRFVPNGDFSENFILSASDDRTMILWDIDTAQPLRTFRGSPAAITGMNISPDGTQMVTTYGRLDESRAEPVDGSSETLVYVWELTGADDLREWTLANRYIRPLSPAECDQYDIQDCDGEIPASIESASVAPSPIVPPTVVVDTATSDADESTSAPEPTAIVADEDEPVVVNTVSGNLNVRGSDTTSASVVTTLSAGEQAAIIGRSTGDTRWYQIRLESGQVGWVRNDIVAIRGDVANVPNISPPPVVQAQPTAVPANTSGSSNPAPTVQTASSQANLQITGLGFVPETPQCLQNFTVQLNITNSGTEPTSGDATIAIFDRHVATGTQGPSGSATVPILNPNGNFVVSIELNVSTFFAEDHEIVAQVDSLGAVPESNENDNFFTRIYTLGSGSC